MMGMPIEYVQETCKIGQGEATCAFLSMSADGFECGKKNGLESVIRSRLAQGTMGSKGDNCEGWPDA